MLSVPEISAPVAFAMAAALCVALAVTGLLALSRGRARLAHEAIERLRADLAQLRMENGSQGATLVGLAGRIDGLQRQLVTDSRFAGPPQGTAGGSAFELAIRLARSGATVEELVSACMMSRHEAELTRRLHGAATRTAPATRIAAVR